MAIKYEINLLSPLIIKAEDDDRNVVNTLNFIPGSVILGALANTFIKKNNIKEKAEQNSDFFEFFLSNENIFLNGYPNLNGSFATPIPFNLQMDKHGSTTTLFNIFKDIPKGAKLKPLETSFYTVNGNNVVKSEVKTKFNFHHSRDRLLGHSKDGTIFNYESIEEFQKFTGFIVGKDEEKLMKFLESVKELRLGLSKNSQYGHVKISFSSVNYPVSMPQNNEVGLFLVSDLILKNKDGYYITSIEEFEKELQTFFQDDALKIKKSLMRYGNRKSYKSVYHTKEPEITYFKKGSSFLISFSTVPSKELVEKAFYYGIGEKINEGYGKLGFFDSTQPDLNILATHDSQMKNDANLLETSMAKFIISNVYKQSAERLVVRKGIEDANKVAPLGSLKGNLLGRLSLAVSEQKTVNAFKTNFLDKLHSIAKQHLENAYIDQDNLYKFIKEFDIQSVLDKIDISQFDNNFVEQLYKKFFLTFFRVLSKRVKQQEAKK